jgi:hypothetical protein
MASIKWTIKGPTDFLINGIVYSDVDKLYVSTGFDENSTYLSNSRDGINWTILLTLPVYINDLEFEFFLRGLTYIPEKQIYMVFYKEKGKNYGICYTSTDGITWSIKSTLDDLQIGINSKLVGLLTNTENKVSYSSKWDKFVFCQGYIYTSSDLKTWSVNKNISDSVTCVYSDIDDLFVSIRNIYTPKEQSIIITSSDGGSTWISRKQFNDSSLTGLIYGKGVYCVILNKLIDKNTYQLNSTNGIDWTLSPASKEYSFENITNIIYTPESGLFVTNSILLGIDLKNSHYCNKISTDGINWRIINKGEYPGISYSLAYNNNTDTYITASYYNIIFFGTVSLPICFVENTLVSIDGAILPIQNIQPGNHTIRGKPILAITKTVTPEKDLICFEPNSLAINCPTKKTIMTSHHLVNYRGKMVKAKDFLGRIDGVHTVPYDGKVVYNVLMKTHETMNVNGLTVETLDPRNELAKSIIDAKLL